jgi:hypothetical protein
VGFTHAGPSIRLADFGCAAIMRKCGLAHPRGTLSEAPEVQAAIAQARADGAPYPLCVGPAQDVWSLGKRVLPALFPVHECASADATWLSAALPLLASCAASCPRDRPSTQQLSLFFSSVALGDTAETSLTKLALVSPHACPL